MTRICAFASRCRQAAAAQFGAPYLTAHRADLHRPAATRSAAGEHPPSTLLSARESDHPGLSGDGAGDAFADGREVEADIARGRATASIPRCGKVCSATQPARYTQQMAWRCIVPIDCVPTEIGPGNVGAGIGRDEYVGWIGPDGHVICYPIRGGGAVQHFCRPCFRATGSTSSGRCRAASTSCWLASRLERGAPRDARPWSRHRYNGAFAMRRPGAPGPEATTRRIWIGRTLVGRAVTRVAEKAMEAAGGISFFRASGLERLFRDLQGARFHRPQERTQLRIQRTPGARASTSTSRTPHGLRRHTGHAAGRTTGKSRPTTWSSRSQPGICRARPRSPSIVRAFPTLSRQIA